MSRRAALHRAEVAIIFAEHRLGVWRAVGLAADHAVIDRLDYLGLFDGEALEVSSETSPLDLVSRAMGDKLAYASGERDLVVMKHFFVAQFEDRFRRAAAAKKNMIS